MRNGFFCLDDNFYPVNFAPHPHKAGAGGGSAALEEEIKKVKLIISRGRAAVARRAHNPKVGSSILPLATKETPPKRGFLFITLIAK